MASTPASKSQAANTTRLGSTQPAQPSAQPVTVDGSVIPNPYGAVQVRITAASGRITDVATLQIPQGDSTSIQISTVAEPQLRQQVLAAQSARIDGVSGASYTSAGYQQSLQSAIDQLPSDSGITA